MSQPTAVFSAIRGFALAHSRALLMQHLLDAGWRVVVATCPDAHARRLVEMGVELAPVPFARGGLASVADLRSLVALKRLYWEIGPQLVHHFNAKPVLFGCLAARECDARVFNTITGLGYAFTQPGLTRLLSSFGYRMLMKRSSAVIFQNSDDLTLFQQNRWVDATTARLIVGSGVDTERFRPGDLSDRSQLRVLMVSRLIWQKGVGEYAEAAARLRQRFPNVRFQLAGEFEPEHPDGVDRSWIEAKQAAGIIEFLGYVTDMDLVLRQTDLFVLPSVYREGVPRVLMEAGASGVPVITTDAPGCREVVRDGVTGRLVPASSADRLTLAMEEVLGDAGLRQRWGAAARELMCRQCDIRVITQQYLDVYRSAGLPVDGGAASSRSANHGSDDANHGTSASHGPLPGDSPRSRAA